MDRSNSALARRIGRPYRSAIDTPLEVMLRRGPFAPLRRPWPVRLAIGAGLVTLALAACLAVWLAVTGALVGGLVVLWTAVLCAQFGRASLSHTNGLAALRARIEGYPVPVTGHVAHWLAGGVLVPGSFDLVFRERHPLAEATVRLAEPDARLAWRDPSTLRVDLPWHRDARDLPRLDRLVALLSVYRDDLGLERLVLVAADRAALRES